MEALKIADGMIVPPDLLSVAFVRDLEEGGPEAARVTPTTVELRVDVAHCEAFDPSLRKRLVADPELNADRRGTVKVTCDEYRSRRQNLEGARRRMVAIIRRVIRGEPPPDAPEPEPKRPKRRAGAGLIKKQRR